MPQVSVTIDGRNYRMACGEGEESHLTALAADLDARITGMRGSFGEIGDMRLHVMVALTLADELAETSKRLAEARREADEARSGMEDARRRQDAEHASAAAAIAAATRQVEDMVGMLAGPARVARPRTDQPT